MNRREYSNIAILAAVVLLLMTGCASQPLVEPSADPDLAVQPSGDVYLLRGVFNVFSQGMDEIGESLKEKGIKTGVYPGPTWQDLVTQIRSKQEQDKAGKLLVISGHSYGADDSIRLARALDKHGIAVDALILVDPTIPPKIPANVDHCVNIYRSKPSTDWMPWLRGVPVETESPSTRLVNRDIRSSGFDPDSLAEINHFNIEEHPAIQEMVLEEILGIFRQNGFETSQFSQLGQDQ